MGPPRLQGPSGLLCSIIKKANGSPSSRLSRSGEAQPPCPRGPPRRAPAVPPLCPRAARPHLLPLLLLSLAELLEAPQLLTQGQGQLDVGAAHVLHFWGQARGMGPPPGAAPRQPPGAPLPPSVGTGVFPEGPGPPQPGVGDRQDLRCFRHSKEARRELKAERPASGPQGRSHSHPTPGPGDLARGGRAGGHACTGLESRALGRARHDRSEPGRDLFGNKEAAASGPWPVPPPPVGPSPAQHPAAPPGCRQAGGRPGGGGGRGSRRPSSGETRGARDVQARRRPGWAAGRRGCGSQGPAGAGGTGGTGEGAGGKLGRRAAGSREGRAVTSQPR